MFDTDVPYGFLEKMFDTDETMLDVSRYNEMRTEKEPNTINDESEQTGEGLRSSEDVNLGNYWELCSMGSAYVTFAEGEAPATDEAKKSNHALRKLEKCKNDRTLDPHIEEQFGSGRLLACVLSPHGHYGRADRYILEKELEFYMKKIQGKKGRGAGAA